MVTISRKRNQPDSDLCFTGPPISLNEAREKWPSRYSSTSRKTENIKASKKSGTEKKLKARSHYKTAIVDGVVLNLEDDVYYVQEGKGEDSNHIAKIIEFFEGVDGKPYFNAQRFYKAEETVIDNKAAEKYIKEKMRVFLSKVEIENSINCIISKVNIAKIPSKIFLENEERIIPPGCDFYYDMNYDLEHLTFSSVDAEFPNRKSDESTVSIENDSSFVGSYNNEQYMLDLYSGCGAMSTGLCMGASLSGVNLITKWAVDNNTFACESLKFNHPEIEVRNETADDFLILLKEWRRLCQSFSLISKTEPTESDSYSEDDNENEDGVEGESDESEMLPDEFEVGELRSICYGDPKNIKASALHFKVHWKGYDSDEDTWEPYEELRSSCKEKVNEFVTKGFKEKLLPLPEDVHIVCGGPPCQGISGFNRFRNEEDPLACEKNRQVEVYMDIIDYLKPKYVLMENVVDILKFSNGFLARYAVARLANMSYQARLGIMAAGSYGVPQCRNRFFLWGAQPTEKLPPYPLPTHEVATNSENVIPKMFKELKVGYNQTDLLELKTALCLKDVISDLPEVTNFEERDERNYDKEPKTEFQKFIRLRRADTLVSNGEDESQLPILYDHQPLQLSDDDYKRVCNIRKTKGANVTDLGGVIISKNRVTLDPSVERAILKSGKPLIPNYAVKFCKGKNMKPFGRLWWDEIVNTVVTRAEPHNQRILHPEQHRVLTVRENARLQGFPDCYRFHGDVRQKYMQVGNAVAVPVGVALGYAYGMAIQGLCDDKPVIKLPFMYPQCLKNKKEDYSIFS